MAPDAIYLDNNASTKPDHQVVEAVSRSLRDLYANPSSGHEAGRAAAQEVENARERVARLVSCRPRAITFTSGATEADNLAILGLWHAARTQGNRRNTIVVGATEHTAVLEAAHSLESVGARVCVAPVDRCGVIDVDALMELVDDRVLLVSIMAANSETGTVAPLESVVDIARKSGAYVHTDATQQMARLPFDMTDLDIDLVSLSAHKMHGPKGLGALAVGHGVPIIRQVHGGGQERGLRSGTLNTAGIVGFGIAAELGLDRLDESDGIARLRDLLFNRLNERLPGVSLNGHAERRLPNTLNVRFTNADAEAVMASLPRLACSMGSACHSGIPQPSHVLLAMGLSETAANESLRFSLSRNTTEQEIHEAADLIIDAVCYVREAMASEVA